MKIISYKNHGKVFTEENGIIKIGKREGNSIAKISSSLRNYHIIRDTEIATITPLELNIADFSNHPLHEYMNIEGAKALSSALSSIRGDCRKGVDLDSKRCQRGFDRTLKDLKEYGFNITKSDLSDPRLYTLADQLEDDLKQKIRDLKKSGDRDAASTNNVSEV